MNGVAVGWWLVSVGFVSGGLMGLSAQDEDWLGGYGNRRRRLVRLGHIALIALGGLNIAWPLTTTAQGVSPMIRVIRDCFLVGGLTMGPFCFLTAWQWPCRILLIVPTTALIIGAILAALWSS